MEMTHCPEVQLARCGSASAIQVRDARCRTSSSAGTARAAAQPAGRGYRAARHGSSCSPTSPRPSVGIGGLATALEVARRARGRSSTRSWSTCCAGARARSSAGLDEATPAGTYVIAVRAGARAAARKPQTDAALAAIADFADLKSPYTTGHSRGVAELASGGFAAGPRRGATSPNCPACRPDARHGPARDPEHDLGQARARCQKPRWSACACIPI